MVFEKYHHSALKGPTSVLVCSLIAFLKLRTHRSLGLKVLCRSSCSMSPCKAVSQHACLAQLACTRQPTCFKPNSCLPGLALNLLADPPCNQQPLHFNGYIDVAGLTLLACFRQPKCLEPDLMLCKPSTMPCMIRSEELYENCTVCKMYSVN